jgi:hypothetical protein
MKWRRVMRFIIPKSTRITGIVVVSFFFLIFGGVVNKYVHNDGIFYLVILIFICKLVHMLIYHEEYTINGYTLEIVKGKKKFSINLNQIDRIDIVTSLGILGSSGISTIYNLNLRNGSSYEVLTEPLNTRKEDIIEVLEKRFNRKVIARLVPYHKKKRSIV